MAQNWPPRGRWPPMARTNADRSARHSGVWPFIRMRIYTTARGCTFRSAPESGRPPGREQRCGSHRPSLPRPRLGLIPWLRNSAWKFVRCIPALSAAWVTLWPQRSSGQQNRCSSSSLITCRLISSSSHVQGNFHLRIQTPWPRGLPKAGGRARFGSLQHGHAFDDVPRSSRTLPGQGYNSNWCIVSGKPTTSTIHLRNAGGRPLPGGMSPWRSPLGGSQIGTTFKR